MNILKIEKGYGKLLPFFINEYEGKVMLVGLNPSYRRFPEIYQVFGGTVNHKGSGYKFMMLLKQLKLLDKVYITNLIKCSCEDNNPSSQSYDSCFEIFKKELELVQPSKIIALGNKPFEYLNTQNLKSPLVRIYHPVYWSNYHQITTEQYSNILKTEINDIHD
jgi:uracil-DNA glycosylase family 4